MVWVWIFLGMSWADSGQLMRAQTAARVAELHKRAEELTTLKHRCRSEIRQQVVPYSCFRWNHEFEDDDVERRRRQHWFGDVCVRALQRRRGLVRFTVVVDPKTLPQECRKALERARADWRYQAQKEDGGAILEFMVEDEKVGRKIEMSRSNEIMVPSSIQPVDSPGASGRRLN